jgi:Transposase DNA-binding
VQKQKALLCGNSKKTSALKPWIVTETANSNFPDERLAKRFGSLLERISHGIGDSIPAACQDWANTKAAYRFMSNKRVTEAEILGGHFNATEERTKAIKGPLLILHDTSEFVFQRGTTSTLGLIGRPFIGATKDGELRHHTLRGILMHSSLVVTPTGLPLGLSAIKFWTRPKFKGCNALKRTMNPTRMPIHEKESYRWLENVRQTTDRINRPGDCVHIGDRESDIYELFCVAEEVGTRFLIRTCVDRLAGDGHHTVADQMNQARPRGVHRVHSRTKNGDAYEALLSIKYETVQIRPPIGKQKDYPVLTLTVIHAVERTKPKGRERIQWKLVTNLPVASMKAAIEKLDWYAMRWKIETFHKIMKSGCKAEESKLRTSERLVNLISVFCIISWRIFWMTMVAREERSLPATAAFTPVEMQLLDHLVKKSPDARENSRSLGAYILKLAQLGGYLARAADPPPGNLVMWRGISRLNDIQSGFNLARELVGN